MENLLGISEDTAVPEAVDTEEKVITPEPIKPTVEAEAKSEPEVSNYEKLAVSHMDAKHVKTLNAQGELSDDDVKRYVVERDIREGFLDMPAHLVH